MKSLFKLSLLVAMGLFINHQANAQAYFGIYGGMNTAGLEMGTWKASTDPMDLKPTLKSIRRLTFGVTAELPLSKYIFFAPEIAWTTKGGIIYADSGYSDIFGGGTTVYKTVNNLDLHYLQVPLMMKVRWRLTNPKPLYPHEGTGKPLYLEFYLGPVFNYLIIPRSNSSITTTHTPAGATEPEIDEKKLRSGATQSGLKAIDVSASVGANLKYTLSKRTFIFVGARYSMNFMNINETAIRNDYQDNNGKAKINYPTLKNTPNIAVTAGITATFTKRRYWNHPRMKKRRF